jgi:hypothetical protein
MTDDNGVARIPLRSARAMKPLVSAAVLGLLPIPLVPEIRADATGDQPTTLDDHSGRCPRHVVPIAERMAIEEELARIHRELEASESWR